jgi:LysR family hydrogen peroxide-inducible transcriptional activator
MHLPTLRQLQFLTALADAGSFSRAAEACLVTQPTLSAAIKEIETLIGTPLVERTGRASKLTGAGEIAVERARQILAETEEMVLLARGAGTPLTGTFRLGAIPTIAPFLLPETVKRLRKDYKDLKLYLREDKTVSLLAALQARTLDAAIIALPWHTPGIDTLTVGAENFQLVFPVGHKLASQTKFSLEDIQKEALLLLEDGHCMRGTVAWRAKRVYWIVDVLNAPMIHLLEEKIGAHKDGEFEYWARMNDGRWSTSAVYSLVGDRIAEATEEIEKRIAMDFASAD